MSHLRPSHIEIEFKKYLTTKNIVTQMPKILNVKTRFGKEKENTVKNNLEEEKKINISSKKQFSENITCF